MDFFFSVSALVHVIFMKLTCVQIMCAIVQRAKFRSVHLDWLLKMVAVTLPCWKWPSRTRSIATQHLPMCQPTCPTGKSKDETQQRWYRFICRGFHLNIMFPIRLRTFTYMDTSQKTKLLQVDFVHARFISCRYVPHVDVISMCGTWFFVWNVIL